MPYRVIGPAHVYVRSSPGSDNPEYMYLGSTNGAAMNAATENNWPRQDIINAFDKCVAAVKESQSGLAVTWSANDYVFMLVHDEVREEIREAILRVLTRHLDRLKEA